MMDLRNKKDRILSNVFVVAATELGIVHFGLFLMEKAYVWICGALSPTSEAEAAFRDDAICLGLFAIPIALCLLYVFLTKRETLRVFREGGFAKGLRATGLGLLVGLGANGVAALLAGLTGTVRFSFNGFSGYLLWILPLSFFQCTAEEVLLRGYVPKYMEGRHDKSAIAFVSGALFIFHHTSNMEVFGFNAIFCLNVFLCGVLLCLLVWVSGNFWTACGFHFGWNYMQSYLLGLPNSGWSSPFGLLRGVAEQDNFFYNTVYGSEGCLLTTVLYAAMIGILTLILVRRNEKDTEIIDS